jgi:hypothetical protein
VEEPAQVPPATLSWLERQERVVGGREILSKRVRRALESNIHSDETLRFCLKGDFDHSLIALDDRLLIVKAGVFAGTTFGARVATIYYKEITGIEVNTGLLNCVVEVSTASYPALGKKSAWFAGRTSATDVETRRAAVQDPLNRHSRFGLASPAAAALLAALLAACATSETRSDDDARYVPEAIQAQLPLDISLGNLCTHAETPLRLARDLRQKAEVMLRELHDHPDSLVTYTFYTEEDPPERKPITVRELAQLQLNDLKSGEQAERLLGGSCAPELQRRVEEALSQ